MKFNEIAKIIMQGYESIPIDDSKIISIDKRVDGLHEFAFRFPSYLDEEDLFKIGKQFKNLKITYTHNPERISEIFAHNDAGKEVKPVDILFNNPYLLIAPQSYVNINDKVHQILQRESFLVEKCASSLGQVIIYERYGIVYKKENEELTHART